MRESPFPSARRVPAPRPQGRPHLPRTALRGRRRRAAPSPPARRGREMAATAPARGQGRAPRAACWRRQGEPAAPPDQAAPRRPVRARPAPPLLRAAAAVCAAGSGAGGRRGGCPFPLFLRPHHTARLRRAACSPRGAPPSLPSPRCHRRSSPAVAAALPIRPYGGLPQARPADPAGPQGHGQPAPHQLHQSHDRGRLRVSEAGGLRLRPAPRCPPRRPASPPASRVVRPLSGEAEARCRGEGLRRAPSARYPLPGDTPVTVEPPPPPPRSLFSARCAAYRAGGDAGGPSVPPGREG